MEYGLQGVLEALSIATAFDAQLVIDLTDFGFGLVWHDVRIVEKEFIGIVGESYHCFIGQGDVLPDGDETTTQHGFWFAA